MDNATDKPLRVCFYILRAYPLFNPSAGRGIGGAEVDLYLVATELAKDDRFQVSFVVGDYGQDPVELRENVTVIRSANIEKNLFLQGRRIWRALRRADAQIYLSKAFSLGMVLPALFCRLHKRKYVYRTASVRECNGAYTGEHPLRGKAVLWALRSARKVLTQNHRDAEHLLATTGVRSMVIRNGHRLEPAEDLPRDTILWVGRSVPVKRPELFVAMARQMPDLHFTMICRRWEKDDNYADLLAQARECGNLNFIESVGFREISDYFKRAQVFVNTSDTEGFPNTFIQACNSAAPILSLNVNPDGFLDEYNCGICCNGNRGALADSLRTLLADGLGAGLGRNGRQYVLEHHDVTRIVEQYKTLFFEVAAE